MVNADIKGKIVVVDQTKVAAAGEKPQLFLLIQLLLAIMVVVVAVEAVAPVAAPEVVAVAMAVKPKNARYGFE